MMVVLPGTLHAEYSTEDNRTNYYLSYRCCAPERPPSLNSVSMGRRYSPGSIRIVPFDYYAVPFCGNPSDPCNTVVTEHGKTKLQNSVVDLSETDLAGNILYVF